uniref:RING-type domain-containing protein n=1 Tax=Amphimedon queenslandica TaxID=400682 RepID=A0A1X7T0C6_AMPQE
MEWLVGMAQFSKKKVSLVKELPEHVEIECPVCLNILTDPHLVSCCGHNFCGSCIERVKASNESCPMCKEKEYQSFVDKKCSRIINGLEVYCSNKDKGCQWKGELKNMSTHLNKEKREGECQHEEVKCQYVKCQERKQRRYLKDHEDKECPHRPFQCQYCRSEGTFLSITKDHYEECRQYPVTCPNKCVSTNMLRGSLTAHINECPLEPVDCVFSWAGCNDKPLRKDVHVHTADTKHMTLLAVACGQLKKENEQMKVENAKIKEENEKMKEEIEKLKIEDARFNYRVHSALADDPYPLLPIDVTEGSEAVHFYTGVCGWHMSARMMRGDVKHITEKVDVTSRRHKARSVAPKGRTIETRTRRYAEFFILLAVHEVKFKSKLSKIFAKLKDKDIPLIVDTEAADNQLELPHDILNGIEWSDDDTTVPEGVIKINI